MTDGDDARRGCQCDDLCGAYGDCCTDSPRFDPVAQTRAAGAYRCARVDDRGAGAYTAARCPDAWPAGPVRDACERPARGQPDGMLGNPVTSRSTGRAYRNRFCAACNGDAADAVLWDTRLVCDGLSDKTDAAAVLATLRYRRADDDGGGRWTARPVPDGPEYECEPAAAPPAMRVGGARPCLPDAVTACHPRWPHDDIRSNCDAYTTVVYNDGRPYRNIHCAMCNHVPVQNLTCDRRADDWTVGRFGPRSFTALFAAGPDGRRAECRDRPDAFYDPFHRVCRDAHDALVSADDPSPSPPSPSAANSTDGDADAAATDDSQTPGAAAAAEAFHSVALTYAGLGVSVVFLVAHLAVFAALPDMKNLSGKNLASFCVSLLCSYAAFVTGNWLRGPACYAVAVLTYYAFLTSFAWTLVMAFDCWRTLRLATVELRVTTGRQTKKFLVYSAVCWLVPAMAAFVAVAADAVPGVPATARPRFGAGGHQCWFGGKTALLVFFAGPLAAVMAVNAMLYVWTAYMIHASRATVRHVNTRHVRRDSRMYCRLAVLMGLSWTAGLAASYTDSPYVWTLFVALNAFQGAFVFAAFTCRRRVLDALVQQARGRQDHREKAAAAAAAVTRNHHHLHHHHHHNGVNNNNNDDDGDGLNVGGHHDKHHRARPPPPSSFTWSSGGDLGAPVSSEKTSDTLY